MKKIISFQISFIFITILFALVTPSAAQEMKDKDNDNAVPIFKDGEAQIVPAFNDPDKWIQHDLWVETEFDTDGDGKPDRMHVDVTRPYQTDSTGLKLPVIYISSPYYGGTASFFKRNYFWDVDHELGKTPPERTHPSPIKMKSNRPVISKTHTKWVAYGYIVVHSSSPGTGLSQGSPTCGGDNESLAPKAVIDWLCGRAKGYTSLDENEEVIAYWSTGKIGMTGTSYNGTLSIAAATTGVEGLEAIIPIAPSTSYYHYYRSNGLIRSPGGWIGEDIDVLYDFIHSGDESKRAYSDSIIRGKELAEGMDRIKGDYNDFWAGRDYLNHLDSFKTALLMSHGFNDWNVMPEHSFRFYEAVKAKGLPSQIFYHQGKHGGPPPFKQMNRWFTRYLHGIENGVEEDPRAWIVRENDKRSNPTSYKDYPNPGASDVTLYLKKGTPKTGELTFSLTEKQGKESFIDNVKFTGTDLANHSDSEHRLLYLTPILSEKIHISGTPKITIKLSSSKPAANLSVWLISLPWNDKILAKVTDNIITRGWADPQNYKSLTESEALEPGKFYEMTFNLQPDDQIIPAGQQIGLMIFSSDKEFTLHPKAGTELTIDLGATSLTLPIVGGINTYKKAVKE